MSLQAQLSQGIKAAKNGDKAAAQDLLYAVLDVDPRNETAWVWLSYSVDKAEDRQICLENVLAINPGNEYALRSLAKLGQQVKLQETVAVNKTENIFVDKPSKSRSIPLLLTIAFWFGLGFLLVIASLIDIINWGLRLIGGPTLPDYITPYQLWMLTIAVAFMVLGIVLLNVAWALYVEHKIGYYASIIFAFCIVLVGPIAVLLSENPNYMLAIFLIVMPALVLFLTLISQMEIDHGTELAAYPERS